MYASALLGFKDAPVSVVQLQCTVAHYYYCNLSFGLVFDLCRDEVLAAIILLLKNYVIVDFACLSFI